MSKIAYLPVPDLGIPVAEAARRFSQLQEKLVPMWPSMQTMTSEERTIVVVPSQTAEFDVRGAEMQAYEERFLFLLFLLRQPKVKMIYVTSQSILPATIDYYLNLMPGKIGREARSRLFLVAPEDRSDRPLTVKLLERPNLIEHVRSLIPDPDNAHLVPYITTHLERDLALLLGIPIYGADPKFFCYGTKSGGRELFGDVGVSYPRGFENLHTVPDVIDAIARMRRDKPAVSEVMLKLNEGISGEGNAVIDLHGLPTPGSEDESRALAKRVREMKLEYQGTRYEDYVAKLLEGGGIVEERIVGDEVRSPSVQLRITPQGELELLSTHDQLLGGPTGQLYIGCRFPSDPAYAKAISSEAIKVGRRLAKEGVVGRFAVDFLVVKGSEGNWHAYAIELNLRKGGTTHPFLTLQYLTDGTYDPERAVFETAKGLERYYVASDHLESSLYRTFSPEKLIEIASRRGLDFDHHSQTGAVFHMLATSAENGRIGVTTVGRSPKEADQLFHRIQDVLEEEAQHAQRPLTLPAA